MLAQPDFDAFEDALGGPFAGQKQGNVVAAFAQRRKTMRSALAGWAGSAAEAERRLRAAGIDPQIRGEKLSVADFVRLAQVPVVPDH